MEHTQTNPIIFITTSTSQAVRALNADFKRVTSLRYMLRFFLFDTYGIFRISYPGDALKLKFDF